MILDTVFFIDLLRNDPAAVKKANELEQLGTMLATTTVSVFELWRGFGKLNQEKMEKARSMLDQLKIYPLDNASAKRAGNIAQLLDSKGQTIDPEDAMIAGIALENNEEVLTRNIKHFNRIPKLIVGNY